MPQAKDSTSQAKIQVPASNSIKGVGEAEGQSDRSPAFSPSEDPRDAALKALQERLAELETRLMQSEAGQAHSSAVSGQAIEGTDLGGDWELVLYDPTKDPNRPLTRSYFMVPVPKAVASEKEGDEPRTVIESIALIPGIQKMRSAQVQDILGSTSEPLQALIKRGIIRRWSQTADLRAMDEVFAQDTIEKCEGVNLLAEWAKLWNDLTPLVKRALEEQEAKLRQRPGQALGSRTRQVFGQTVIN